MWQAHLQPRSSVPYLLPFQIFGDTSSSELKIIFLHPPLSSRNISIHIIFHYYRGTQLTQWKRECSPLRTAHTIHINCDLLLAIADLYHPVRQTPTQRPIR